MDLPCLLYIDFFLFLTANEVAYIPPNQRYPFLQYDPQWHIYSEDGDQTVLWLRKTAEEFGTIRNYATGK